MNKVFLWL